MMQSILQSSNTPIRLPVVNTYRKRGVGGSSNTIKKMVNPFQESMFVRVIPTSPCASCNGAR